MADDDRIDPETMKKITDAERDVTSRPFGGSEDPFSGYVIDIDPIENLEDITSEGVEPDHPFQQQDLNDAAMAALEDYGWQEVDSSVPWEEYDVLRTRYFGRDPGREPTVKFSGIPGVGPVIKYKVPEGPGGLVSQDPVLQDSPEDIRDAFEGFETMSHVSVVRGTVGFSSQKLVDYSEDAGVTREEATDDFRNPSFSTRENLRHFIRQVTAVQETVEGHPDYEARSFDTDPGFNIDFDDLSGGYDGHSGDYELTDTLIGIEKFL